MKLTEDYVNSLFIKEYSALLNKLTALLHNRSDAEDIAQNAYLKLIAKADEGYEVQYGRAFLFQVAQNLAIDYLRRCQNEKKWFVASSLDDQHIDEKGNTAYEFSSASPEAGIDAERQLNNVIVTISDLPDKCQLAFFHHKFRELSYKETAEEMGLSVSMVEKYMSKALHHVRESETQFQRAAAG